MTFGLTHIILPVEDLTVARAFYAGALDLQVVAETTSTLDLESGFTVIRLAEIQGGSSPVTLRLQTVSMEIVLEKLANFEGTAIHGPTRSPDLELLLEVDDPFGNSLIFWRRLTEDEYDAPPSLPIERTWDREAQALMQSLLAHVPALFRDVARSGAVAEAEFLASGDDSVGVESVVRAYIRATPRLLRSRVRKPLSELGFDPDRYRADFDV